MQTKKKYTLQIFREEKFFIFTKSIDGSYDNYRFYHILGVAIAAGAEAKPKLPGASSITILLNRTEMVFDNTSFFFKFPEDNAAFLKLKENIHDQNTPLIP
jgi:hypothetical protein